MIRLHEGLRRHSWLARVDAKHLLESAVLLLVSAALLRNDLAEITGRLTRI